MTALDLDRAGLMLGDCLALMRALPSCSVDAVVTDPPYELGFMGKTWDASGIAYSVELWREVLRVLKPGGHLLAFGGTRTYHRMACAIEDAGFEVRDSLHWMYGTGFPKSLTSNTGMPTGQGTALKPGHEPIVLARKPLEGTVAANVQKWGTGGLNIDGTRIQSADARSTGRANSGGKGNGGVFGDSVKYDSESSPLGRWPANVLLDEAAAAELDAQSGVSGDRARVSSGKSLGMFSETTKTNTGQRGFADSGGASRFFKVVPGGVPHASYCRPWECNCGADRANGLADNPITPFRYVAKPSRKERDLGCADLPAKTAGEATDREEGSAGIGPRAGANRTGGAKNFHPTVKPIELMRYLCRLVTPPGGIVLDPFTGSGTTGIAALNEGLRFIGMEASEEYFPITAARITHAHNAANED